MVILDPEETNLCMINIWSELQTISTTQILQPGN